MKKKIFAAVLAVLTAASVLAGCGAKKDSGEAFVFKHGFDQEFPPYSYLNSEGETGGFDVELCKAVCEYNGWTYEPVPVNWDSKDMELNSGSCDCIWSGFTITKENKDKFLWSKPYSDNVQMILVNKNSGIVKLTDLADRKVGVQSGTSAYSMLKDEEGAAELTETFKSLEVYPDYTVAFNDLKAGAIDAIAIDITAGNHLIEGETDYVYLEEDMGSEIYGIAFRKEDTELCKKVEEALDALAADGTVDKIAKNYPEIYDFITLGK